MNVVSKLFRRTVGFIVGTTLYFLPAVLVAWFGLDILGIDRNTFNIGFLLLVAVGIAYRLMMWIARNPWLPIPPFRGPSQSFFSRKPLCLLVFWSRFR